MLRIRRILVLGVTLVMLGVALPTVAQARVAALSKRDCGEIPPGVDAQVVCYTLSVREQRDSRDTTMISLAVLVLKSRSSTPEPDPVVFLSGGPGDPAIEGFENFVTSPMHENRDLIFLDQRGTGLSELSLDCREREEAARVDLSRAEPNDVELEAMREATIACRKRLKSEGIDLDAYDTEANAADVADLRVALEIDEWNLYGVSYGTRLALETMRSHPEGIRSVVLDSVYPTDVGGLEIYTTGAEAAFERLFAACAADAACAVQQPDLDQILQSLVDRYNETPAEITVGDETLVITGDDIYAGVFDAMYDTDLIPALPTIIENIADGDLGILQIQAEQALDAVSVPMKGMFLSMECADAAKFADAKREAKLATKAESALVRYSAQPYCEVWGVEPLPDAFSKPVRSKIPALVLAGSLDPITPASDSKRAAKTLENSQYVEFAGFGHAVTNGTDCPRAIRQAFLDDPDADLDTTCAEVPAPGFLSQGLI